MESKKWPVIAITSVYIRDLRGILFTSQSYSGASANEVKLRQELELLLSQRRIRSIYQANTEIQHGFQSIELSAHDIPDLPVLDDLWQEFLDFDFGEAYSLQLSEPSWLMQEQLAPLKTSTEAGSQTESPKPPKDILDIIESLPSCSFCREQHIRCDRQLPCCGACKRSSRQCVYFDVALSQDIPRRLQNHIHITFSSSVHSEANVGNLGLYMS